MKILPLIIFIFLVFSWTYVLFFSIKKIKEREYSSKSLFVILFLILIVDSIRTIIENGYFGTRLASQYGILPAEVFRIFSDPSFIFIPKLINALATILIIYLIVKRLYPEKEAELNILKEKYQQEKKDKLKLSLINKNLDKLVHEKTKELEALNKNLQEKIDKEIEKNKFQEQKLFSQTKMAAMGEMLSNIAHQWRQPLSAISAISTGSKLKSEMDVLEKLALHKDLDQITTTVKHLSETIQDFQNFFKPNKDIQEFLFKDTIDSTLKIITPVIKSNYIDIEVNIDCNCKILGPYNEYTQVLLNVISNAKDALLNKKENERFIKITTKKEKNFCCLMVEDNAGGIKEDVLPRIFEPYFTTKHQYHGTGLGLYMSKEIIEKHMHGSLEVKNIEIEYKGKTYKGAQFKIITKSLKKRNDSCSL